jgi:hypothetical protein
MCVLLCYGIPESKDMLPLLSLPPLHGHGQPLPRVSLVRVSWDLGLLVFSWEKKEKSCFFRHEPLERGLGGGPAGLCLSCTYNLFDLRWTPLFPQRRGESKSKGLEGSQEILISAFLEICQEIYHHPLIPLWMGRFGENKLFALHTYT